MDTSGNNLDTPSQNNDATPKKSSKKRKQQSNSSTKPVKKNRKLEFKDISGSSKPGSTPSDTSSASASASASTPNIINIPKHLLPKDVNSGIIVEINELPSFFNTLLEEEKRESENKKKKETESKKKIKKEEKETKDKDKVDEKETTEKMTEPNEDLDPHVVYAKEMLYEDWDYAEKHQDKERADYEEQQDIDLEEEEDEEEDEEDDEEEETPYFSIKINQPTDLIPAHLQPIDSLQKLMCLGHLYRKKSFYRKNYSINVKGLYDMIPALQELNNLVGLDTIKKKVIDQILFFSQDLHNQKWYYEQHQKLLAQEEEKNQRQGYGMGPMGMGGPRGPRHPLESLLHILPLKGKTEMYWAGGGGLGGRDSKKGSNRKHKDQERNYRDDSEEEQEDQEDRRGKKHRRKKKSNRHHQEQEYQPEKEMNQDDCSDMLHTVIAGPPGVGKTVFGKILAKIYMSLGITSRDTFKIVRRSDLVGEYLGQTAIKTQKAIDSALGGVLFIDEAYSLGCNDGYRKSDSFSKECIDTINQNLSEKKGQFICIIAGYPDELERHFFSVNPGLKRRFSFHYKIEGYDGMELTEILIRKIEKMAWKIDPLAKEWLVQEAFVEKHKNEFPNFGGDIETWLLNIKIVHGRRVFGMSPIHHKVITKEDIEKGYDRYQESRKKKKEDPAPTSMYM